MNGKQLELNFQDSQGDPESAVSAYGKLMDWGMNVFLGGVLSGETASVVAAAKAEGMKGDVVILTATSGDTGKAALEGFHDVKGTRIIVFYPYGGVSASSRPRWPPRPAIM